MAYNLRQINTLDLKPSTGVGVALPFSNEAVFQTVYTTKEQLKYNLINFMLTDKRERLFLPSFGLGLRSRLFEQITIDTYEEIKAQVITGIESYFPTVRVEQLDVTGDPNRGIIYIQFSYSITNTRESDNITLSIQNG